MASLYVFCTGDELLDWIRKLCVKKNLLGIEFRGSGGFGTVFKSIDDITIHDDSFGLFLFPAATKVSDKLVWGDVNSRGWGWIYIRPNFTDAYVRKEKVLYMSEIHGEDFEDEPVHPAKYVRWLKGHLRRNKIIVAGVFLKLQFDEDMDEDDIRNNINYTKGAVALFEQGYPWKQTPGDNLIFVPVLRDD